MKKRLIIIIILITTIAAIATTYILPYVQSLYNFSQYQILLSVIVIVALSGVLSAASFDLVFTVSLENFLKKARETWEQEKSIDAIDKEKLSSEMKEVYYTIQTIVQDGTKRIKELESQEGYTDDYYRLISTISHQLRTPITGLHWALGAMEEDITKGKVVDPTMVSGAVEAVSRVSNIIEELLVGINKDKSKKKTFEVIDIENVLKNVIKESRLLSLEHNMKISVTKTSKLIPLIKGVPYEMGFVIHSLITNAITYGTPGTEITITLGQDGGYSTFAIHNEGVGIPEAEKVMLFSQFNRGAEAIRINPNGSGLGLYLVKKIMASHGGTVTLESSKKEGTTFLLKFPISNKGELETFITY